VGAQGALQRVLMNCLYLDEEAYIFVMHTLQQAPKVSTKFLINFLSINQAIRTRQSHKLPTGGWINLCSEAT
jgi:hypothetical protein